MHATAIDELPLILEPTLSISRLERLHPHDEVIDEFLRDGLESSIAIIVPLIIEDLIFFGAFHIIDIENDLTEVHIGYQYIPEESSVEHIGIRADNFDINMELYRVPGTPANPQTSHKEHNLVRAQGSAKGLKIPIEGLLRVINILGEVLKGKTFTRDIDLD